MDILISMVKNLLFIVVIATFLEILLPDNSMRPFVRFTIGLFVILAILNPILSAFYSERQLMAQAWDLSWEYEGNGDHQQNGLEINRDIQKAGQEAMRGKLEQQIGSLALLVPGVGDLSSKVVLDPGSGELSEVIFVIAAAPRTSGKGTIEAFSSRDQTRKEQQVIREKLTSMMRNFYGLTDRQVVIKFEGG